MKGYRPMAQNLCQRGFVRACYLAQYVAEFLGAGNIKAVTDEYLRALMGVKVHTDGRT
jgi:hypothetical protein